MEQKQEAIDVQAIIDLIWGKRMFILKVSAVFFAVALVYVLSVPRTYTSNVTLAPELTNSSLGSSIGDIAEMAGLGLENTTGDAIYPEIYPELIASKQFLVDLFSIEVVSLDGEINTTLYTYHQKHQKIAWWIYPIAWAKKFAKWVKGEESDKQGVAKAPDPFMLTKHQNAVAEAIKASIMCSVDKKTGVISLKYTAQDPFIAASVVNVIKDKLQEHIVNYRTCKARNDLKYFETLCDEARVEYIKTQEAFATFSDRHKGARLKSVEMQLSRLENDVILAQTAYSQASQQLHLTRAKLQENTPAFAVLSCASVPLKPSAPRRMFIVVVFVMMGVVSGAAYVYMKEQIQNNKK